MSRFPRKTDTGKPFLNIALAKGNDGETPYIVILNRDTIIIPKDPVSNVCDYTDSFAAIYIYHKGIQQKGWVITENPFSPPNDVVYTITDYEAFSRITITEISNNADIIPLIATKGSLTLNFVVHYIALFSGLPGANGAVGAQGIQGVQGVQGVPGPSSSGLIVKKASIEIKDHIDVTVISNLGLILLESTVEHGLALGDYVVYLGTSNMSDWDKPEGYYGNTFFVTEIVSDYIFRINNDGFQDDTTAVIKNLQHIRRTNIAGQSQTIFLNNFLPKGSYPLDCHLYRLDTNAYELYTDLGTSPFPESDYGNYWKVIPIFGQPDNHVSLIVSVVTPIYSKFALNNLSYYLRLTLYPGRNIISDYPNLALEFFIAYIFYDATFS